jgi:alanine racemase
MANAVLTIDLAAIVANWRLLRDRAAPAECAAVVKADGYGLGAPQVTEALAAAGCKTFYVAQLEEGMALRRQFRHLEIALFDGAAAGAEGEIVKARLVPVLNSLEQIERWAAWTRAQGKPPPPAMMHIDTGLNRLGLPARELEALAARPHLLAAIDLRLVMSHLIAADMAESPLNARQLALFATLRRRLPAAPAALSASSGIFQGAAYHLDQVRPGAALYGVAPRPDGPNPMAPVIELRARILQTRDVDSPQTVGYGATHSVRRPARIATIGVGYADGYLRALGNRGMGFIGGFPAPLVGRVSMDLITLDITDVPRELARSGAMVELIGPHRTIDALAGDAGTIAYEILTSLGHRYQRRYLPAERGPGHV